MKVLVINSKFSPEYAGPGFRSRNTYKRLRQKFNISYDVLTNSIEFSDNKVFMHEGICVTRVARRLPTINKGAFWAKFINHIIYLINYIYQGLHTIKILKSGKYDLIHTFGSSISVNTGMLYAKITKTPLLREICNNGTTPHPLLPLKLNNFFTYRFNKNNKVVAVSKRIAIACQKDGLSSEFIWTRPNPIEEKRFCLGNESKMVFRRKLSKFKSEDTVLLNVSKFEPGKNQIFLIDVMRILPKNFKLLLLGPITSSGPFNLRDQQYLASLNKAIQINGLRDRVQVITGFSEEVEEYFKLSDVFVFPTLLEALGTPMLESIACGIPVVANTIEGVTDFWIEEGKTGYTCQLEPHTFADKIKKACMISPEILRQGSEDILSKASSEVIDEQYYKIMQDLVGAPSN